MILLPLTTPVSLFLAGGLFCSFFCEQPGWMVWIFGFFLAIWRWKFIKLILFSCWKFCGTPVRLFSYEDFRMISYLDGKSGPSLLWTIPGLWSSGRKTKCWEAACISQLSQLCSQIHTGGTFKILIVGSGTAEEVLFIRKNFGHYVSCADNEAIHVSQNSLLSQKWPQGPLCDFDFGSFLDEGTTVNSKISYRNIYIRAALKVRLHHRSNFRRRDRKFWDIAKIRSIMLLSERKVNAFFDAAKMLNYDQHFEPLSRNFPVTVYH